MKQKEKELINKEFDNKFLGQMLNFDIQTDVEEDIHSEAENEDDIQSKIKKKKKREDVLYKKRFKKLKQKIQQYFYAEHQEEEKWKEMRSLQEDFDHYLDLLMLAYYKVQQNSIHPKIFGLGLSGALMKTMATALFTTVFALLRFVFFA